MSFDFPELTTMGALFRFAAVLERAALEALEAASQKPGDQEQLLRMLKKRRRRVDELERARKEKLNETVLEPLMDMPNTPYIPAISDSLASLDRLELLRTALEVERKTMTFYGDAVDKAGPVLAEVRRIFIRFQKESSKNEKTLLEMIG